MTQVEIFNGEVAIAKWLGYEVRLVKSHEELFGLFFNGKRVGKCSLFETTLWPRYSTDERAFVSLLLALAEKDFHPQIVFNEFEWYCYLANTDEVYCKRAGTPQMALFKATLQLPQVQILLNKTTEEQSA